MALSDFPSIDPQFTQIPLGRNLLPLDDLQAAGGYDRQLILPDDLPPVLSQGWTQGPVKPRLITGQDDGSVNVYVTGGAGGGGGGTVIRPKMHNDFRSGNAGDQLMLVSALGPINAIWGINYTMLFYPPAVAPTPHFPFAFHFLLRKPGVDTVDFFLAREQGYTSETPPALTEAQARGNYYFPNGIDPSLALGVTDGKYDVFLYANICNWDFDYQIIYT